MKLSLRKSAKNGTICMDKLDDLYNKIFKLEVVISKDNKMKFELLEIFKENNYSNKDLMLRKIKSILDKYIDPESEVNHAN